MTGIPPLDAIGELAATYDSELGTKGAPPAPEAVEEPPTAPPAEPSEAPEALASEDADREGEQPPAEAEDDLDPAFRERLVGHVERAAKANSAALEQRFGGELQNTMRAANRTLQEFATPELRALLRDAPALAIPDFVDMLARAGREVASLRKQLQAQRPTGPKFNTELDRIEAELTESYDRPAREERAARMRGVHAARPEPSAQEELAASYDRALASQHKRIARGET